MTTDNHPSSLIENISKVLWDCESHRLLAHAGKPTAWEEQPRIIKRDYWRKAIKVLGEFSESASADDVHPRIQKEIIGRSNHEKIQGQEKEIKRLRSLVTQARHTLFEKKLITFEEVKSWHETK